MEKGRTMQIADNWLLQYACVLIAFKYSTVITQGALPPIRTNSFHFHPMLAHMPLHGEVTAVLYQIKSNLISSNNTGYTINGMNLPASRNTDSQAISGAHLERLA